MAGMINIPLTTTFQDEQEATPKVFTEDQSVTIDSPSFLLATDGTADLSITGLCAHRAGD